MSKENTKKSKDKKREKVTDLNLWTYNENCELEMVKIPIQHRMEFLYKFGLVSPPEKQSVLDWLESINNI
jgi:hypothetical protein